MTKTQALQKFFESFGLNAYPLNNVPDDTVFPWLTYEVITGNFGDEPVGISVNLWYHTTSEKKPNEKVKEISDAIGAGGIMLNCDDGAMWIKRGQPWRTNLNDETDSAIKRRLLNVTIEYLTL